MMPYIERRRVPGTGGSRRHGVTVALLSAIIAIVVSGCTLDPSKIALSAQSDGDGQIVRVMFSNALNLPTGADVTFNGIRVGRVTGVDLRRDQVEVVTTIDPEIRVPADASATLRQSTVLGDPSVAITSLSTPTPNAPGVDVIPVERTDAPSTLEDTLAVVANFVNGGSIQDIQGIVRDTNSAFPDLEQTRRVADIVAKDADDLALNTRTIDGLLAAVDSTSNQLSAKMPDFSDMVTPLAMHRWDLFLRGSMSMVSIVLPSIGSIYQQGFFLVPMLNEVNKSIGVVRTGMDAVSSNSTLLESFLSDNLFPFLKRPSMEIVSVTSPEGRELMKDAQNVLRMLGAIR
jgi:phospholipid/cholesterol/gamma-HCH transport system substrate-binding protein